MTEAVKEDEAEDDDDMDGFQSDDEDEGEGSDKEMGVDEDEGDDADSNHLNRLAARVSDNYSTIHNILILGVFMLYTILSTAKLTLEGHV